MSDVVKWILMVTGIISILALLAVGIEQLNIATIGTGFASAITNVLDYVTDPIHAAKGFINNLAGSSVPCNVILFCLLLMPFIKVSARVMITVYRWIFK